MNPSIPRKQGRPSHQEPKILQLNIRMSPQRRAELNELCRLGGRPLSYQIEHMMQIAKRTIDFCDGNDNLKYVEARLAKAKETLG